MADEVQPPSAEGTKQVPFYTLDIELGGEHLRRSFKSAKEARGFLRNEFTSWQRFRSAAAQVTVPTNLAHSFFDRENSFLRGFDLSGTSITVKDMDNFAAAVRNEKIYCSELLPFRKIKHIFLKEDIYQAGLMILFVAAPRQPGLWQSIVQAVDNSGNTLSLAKAISATANVRWGDIVDRDHITRMMEELAPSYDRLEEKAEKLNEQIRNLAQLAQDLRLKIMTQEPITYLNSRRKWHLFGTVALLLIIGGLIIAGWHWGVPWLEAKITEDSFVELAKSSYAPTLLVTLPFIAGFWVLLLIARIYNQIRRSHVDAAEKIVASKMFLAFSEHHNLKPTEAERLLILQTLFRPSPGETAEQFPMEATLRELIKPRSGGT